MTKPNISPPEPRSYGLDGASGAIIEELLEAGSFEWEIRTDRVVWSEGLYRIFGFDPGAFPGSFQAYLDRVHPDDREERRTLIDGLVESGGTARGEHRIVRPDGETRWIESRITVLKDAAGRATDLIGACQDITERRLANQGLRNEARVAHERSVRDPLTGLPNRTLAFDRLEHAFSVARRRGSGLAVLFIDVDGFKQINDRFGHAAGDELLVSIAARLRDNIRSSDTIARIGGDEFLAICEEVDGNLDPDEAVARLHTAFSAPFELGCSTASLGITVGVSSLAGRQLDAAIELVDEADAAMYEQRRSRSGGSRSRGA